VICPQAETACIDRRQSDRLKRVWIEETSTALKSTGSMR
jgi:hypothetical protein